MKSILWILRVLLFAPVAALHAAETTPDVILIRTDDSGWSDSGCYGADLHDIAHLHPLVQQSFTHAYAMSACSRSRAALLAGSTPPGCTRRLPLCTGDRTSGAPSSGMPWHSPT